MFHHSYMGLHCSSSRCLQGNHKCLGIMVTANDMSTISRHPLTDNIYKDPAYSHNSSYTYRGSLHPHFKM